MSKIDLDNLIKIFKERHPTKELIFLYKAGSHFFDLAGPNSDVDYRGVYICKEQDSYESSEKVHFVEYKTKEGDGKNSKDDVDFNLFSLSSFFKLLGNGDFNMMEMLYTPESKILLTTPLFQEIMEIRDSLMVNDISAFLGFIKKEYKRYGVNIFHYDIQLRFTRFLHSLDCSGKTLKEIWPQIQNYSHSNYGEIQFTTTSISNKQEVKEIPAIKIAARAHPQTVKVGHVINAIETVLERYGHRQKSMSESGVEFKGLYHAMRNIYEANFLLDNGRLCFPFPPDQYDILKSIKFGTMPKDNIFALIDSELAKLELREVGLVTNKPVVQERIRKILANLRGRMSVATIISYAA